jgi:hypothetical protein
LDASGFTLAGHTVALNGTEGMSAPSPEPKSNDVPERAGEGAAATVP